MTARTASTTTTCSAPTSATTTTTRRSTAMSFTASLASACSTVAFIGFLGPFRLLARLFWLASKLNGDFAFKDFLPRKLSYSTLSFTGSRKINKSVADWAISAWVLGNGGGFTRKSSRSAAEIQNSDLYRMHRYTLMDMKSSQQFKSV